MKKYVVGIGIVIVLLASGLLPGKVVAGNSWWDKGADVLNSLSEKTEAGGVVKASNAEIGEAFRQALRIGSENVVAQLGVNDGFNADPVIHIPLPEELKTVKTVLDKVGMSQLTDDLELKLNRAAEVATPKAKSLFLQAITDMTFADIQGIYEGPDNSATKYFKGKMTPSLQKEMKPIVEKTLAQVGAVQAYDNVVGEYKALPFMPDVKANLTEHVLQKGMDGIFYYLEKEEASIRKNPIKQTTSLLKKVFGSK